jgi:hypothetical protein
MKSRPRLSDLGAKIARAHALGLGAVEQLFLLLDRKRRDFSVVGK